MCPGEDWAHRSLTSAARRAIANADGLKAQGRAERHRMASCCDANAIGSQRHSRSKLSFAKRHFHRATTCRDARGLAFVGFDIPIGRGHGALLRASNRGISVPIVVIDHRHQLIARRSRGTLSAWHRGRCLADSKIPGGPVDAYRRMPRCALHGLPVRGAPFRDATVPFLVGSN
jgi:hypothetical protein